MRETGGPELASTITLVLQVNRLTKCASHPRNIGSNEISFLPFQVCSKDAVTE